VTTRIVTGRVYDPPSRDDGTRVLIMRLWPRAIRKDRVDLWLRELGPVVPLLRGFLSGKVGWSEYRRRYRAGLARPEAREAVAAVRDLARRGRVTLLCGCADETRCHRSLLARYLARRPARPSSRSRRRSTPPGKARSRRRP
jgi:uncharacterized protein YeaO (DUF488 family)